MSKSSSLKTIANRRLRGIVIAIALSLGLIFAPAANAKQSGITIEYRSFSGVPTIGTPADEYAANLAQLSQFTLGRKRKINLAKISPRPDIPNKDIIAAVGEGGKLVKGTGFDAAYVSGGSLNPAWGFIYNSGIPASGVGFDRFLSFLYDGNGSQSGIDLAQSILDKRDRNIVVIPLVGGTAQGSGYFPKPVNDTEKESGIGLAGLCRQEWTFRYLPPAQNVLDLACDRTVGKEKKIDFVTAVPGGQILDNVIDNKVQAFEFVTPKDDYAVFFDHEDKPNLGDLGLKYLHYPSWHQPFLMTYLIINQQVWDMLSSQQQDLIFTSARASMTTSYAQNLAGQGEALQKMLDSNINDNDDSNDLTLVSWGDEDLAKLKEASDEFIASVMKDNNLSAEDKEDYQQVLSAYQNYLKGDRTYWNKFAATSN